MEIEKFDIDKYIIWLKNLSENCRNEIFEKAEECVINAIEHFMNSCDYTLSSEIQRGHVNKAKKMMKESKRLIGELKESKPDVYKYIDMDVSKYLLPNSTEWLRIESQIKDYPSSSFKELQRRLDGSGDYELNIFKEELDKLNKGFSISLIDAYKESRVLPIINGSRDRTINVFVFDIKQIRYRNYLIERIESYKPKEEKPIKLKWKSNATVLGFIFRELIDKGFIDAPLTIDDEIHTRKVAEILNEIFTTPNGDYKTDTIERALDSEYERRLLNHDELEKIVIPFKKSLNFKTT